MHSCWRRYELVGRLDRGRPTCRRSTAGVRHLYRSCHTLGRRAEDHAIFWHSAAQAAQASAQSLHSLCSISCFRHSVSHRRQASSATAANFGREGAFCAARERNAPQSANISLTDFAQGPSDLSPSARILWQCARQVSPFTTQSLAVATSAWWAEVPCTWGVCCPTIAAGAAKTPKAPRLCSTFRLFIVARLWLPVGRIRAKSGMRIQQAIGLRQPDVLILSIPAAQECELTIFIRGQTRGGYFSSLR